MIGERVGAVVLAAGRSQRMGRPKSLLPWGTSTVIETVVAVLVAAGVEEIVVVSNPFLAEVRDLLAGTPARVVLNPDYIAGEMLSSAKAGLQAQSPDISAVLLVLGDQPQIQTDVPADIIRAYRDHHPRLVVPSYAMRRGHPWLVACELWPEILALPPDATLRDFLDRHAAEIEYIPAATDAILIDLDTPADYRDRKPD